MKQLIYKLLQWVLALLPINRHKVMMMSYYGSQYGCNPKYLSQYITANEPSLSVVWAFTVPERHDVTGVKCVRFMSLRFFYEWVTSGTIVTNYRLPLSLRKRRGQYYIQTWHSSLRLKMIERDAESTLPPGYLEMAHRDSAMIDTLISGCSKSTLIFRRAFWYDGPILECGTPRNDIFFGDHSRVRADVARCLGVSTERRYVLYAPTFRRDHSLHYYDIDFCRLTDTLSSQFGGEWIVLLRLHPHLAAFGAEIQRGAAEVVVDASNYDDIQELLCASDVLISDYSSLVFDFAMSEKPIFLYTSDLEEYIGQDRQLYFDITKLPFDYAHDNDELEKIITNFDSTRYRERLKDFAAQIGSFETGTASAQITRLILNRVCQRNR